MERPNIIVTIDWFLPGTKAGGPVTSMVNLVEQLDEFNFYIITSDTDYCEDEPYANIESNRWIKHSDGVQVYYFSKERLNKANLKQVIKSVHSNTIYINGIFSKFFSRLPLKIAQDLKLNTIVASRGMLSPHGLAVKPLKKKMFLKLVNAKKTYENIHFHATNLEEKSAIQLVITKYKQISAIPNFPRKIKEDQFTSITKEENKVKLISLGRIAEEKGTLVGLEALQHINGDVVLDLYGTVYDENYWQKCQAVIKSLPENIHVEYKGALASDEVMKTLQAYHFLLMPSKGENYGHAIVESLMANRPVVISKHTPWKNLAEKNIGYDVEEVNLHDTIQYVVEMDNEKYKIMRESIHQQLESILEIPSTKEKYYSLFI